MAEKLEIPGDPESSLSADEVIAELKRKCNLKDGPSCTLFGAQLGQEPDTAGKRVAKFLRLGCQYGDSNGCAILAAWQLAGRVPGSHSAAFQNSLTSCRMGNENGCFQTGMLLFQGIGVKQDVSTGLNVLMNNCNSEKHGQSCFEAARMVSALGRAGVLAQEKPLTERNIASLLRRGCENGYQPACDGLLDFEARLAAAAAADATAAPPQPQPAAPATEEH